MTSMQHLETLFADVQRVSGQLCERSRRQAAQELLEPGGRELVLGLPARRLVPFPLRVAMQCTGTDAVNTCAASGAAVIHTQSWWSLSAV